jgi:hypothetical protein
MHDSHLAINGNHKYIPAIPYFLLNVLEGSHSSNYWTHLADLAAATQSKHLPAVIGR